MLKKFDTIIALVKKLSAKYLTYTHKFGIECPKTVEDALELDKHNGNSIWAAKEMKNFLVAFNTLDDGKQLPTAKWILVYPVLYLHCEDGGLLSEVAAICRGAHNGCAT